jgi:hypothetical protein
MTIFKVQKPMTTTDPNRHWMLYPKTGQTYFIKEHQVPERMKTIMGNKFKAFMEISLTVNDKGAMTIRKIKRTGWRNW